MILFLTELPFKEVCCEVVALFCADLLHCFCCCFGEGCLLLLFFFIGVERTGRRRDFFTFDDYLTVDCYVYIFLTLIGTSQRPGFDLFL